jgi:signal transduction histidine kinase
VSGAGEVRPPEERLRVMSRLYRAFAHATAAMNHARTAAELYDGVCRALVEQGGYFAAWTGEADEAGAVRVVAQAGRLGDFLGEVRFDLDPARPERHGPVGDALLDGVPRYTGDWLTDPACQPWRDAAQRCGIRAAAVLPLRQEEQVVAALSLYAAEPGVFDGDMCALAEALAATVSCALTNLKRTAELRHAIAERGRLLRRLVDADEAERARIAADVHDDSIQALAAAELHLGAVRRELDAVAPEVVSNITHAEDALSWAIQRLRELMFRLEPLPETVWLVHGLQDAAAEYLDDLGLEWSVTWTGSPELPPVGRNLAMRAAKEALSNIRRHAQARSAVVEIADTGDGMAVRILDDGVGVPEDAIAGARPGSGLHAMRDRIEVAGGTLQIARPAGGGTELRLWLPAADRHTSSAD